MLKQHHVEIGILCSLAPPTVQRHCGKDKSMLQICSSLSDLL